MKADVILRVRRNERYSVISTLAVEDGALSWKAKGLHTYLITRPDGWQFNRADLFRRSKDGRDATKAALKELRGAGYLTTQAVRNGGGMWDGWLWTVRESNATE